MKIIKTRTKIEAVAVGLLLISIVIGSVWATRTITDTGDTWTGTMMISGNTDFKSGSYYNLSKKIYTSTGRVYNATGANIKTAYYSLNSTGGTVWVPAGTFYMSGQLRLASDKALIGQGMGITTIKAASGNTASIFIGIAASEASMDNITVKDLTINGNLTAGNCISVEGVTDFLFENIEIINPDTNGMAVWFSKRGIINNCRCYNVTDASYEPFAFNNVNQSIMSNLLVFRSNNWAYDFHTCHNCTISNLVAYHCKYGAKWFGDVGEHGSYNTVTNLAFYNTSYTVGASLWIKREHNSTFSNIVLQGKDTGITIDGSTYITLNNFQVNTTDYALYISSSIAVCHHFIISDGIITSGVSYGMQIDSAHNFTISNVQIRFCGNYNNFASCKDFKIVGCDFLSGASYGATIRGCSFFIINSCRIMNNALDGFDTTISANNNYTISSCIFKNNAIGLDIGADHNITIMNCVFNGNSGDGIECDALDSVIIMGCIMWGDPFDDNIVGSHNLTGTAYNIGMTII